MTNITIISYREDGESSSMGHVMERSSSIMEIDEYATPDEAIDAMALARAKDDIASRDYFVVDWEFSVLINGVDLTDSFYHWDEQQCSLSEDDFMIGRYILEHWYDASKIKKDELDLKAAKAEARMHKAAKLATNKRKALNKIKKQQEELIELERLKVKYEAKEATS